MKRALLLLLCSSMLIQVVYADEPSVIPVLDRAMRAKLKSVYQMGVAAGNRDDVFAKFGDSITRSRSFLIDVGCGVAVLGENEHLKQTIEFFRRTRFPSSYSLGWCSDSNSFTRDSVAAHGGWTVDIPLEPFSDPLSECPAPNNTPLRCELHLLKPSIALVMFGTNDVDENDPANFRKKLTRIVQEILLQGVIPVLSTIPPRQDKAVIGRRVDTYNQIIQEIAATLQVPLWNYALALQNPRMNNNGISPDGVHPNVYKDVLPAVFIQQALRFGFNQRNFTALEVLRKIRAQIQRNAPADATTTSNFALYASKKIPKLQPGTSTPLTLNIVRANHAEPITFSVKGQPGGVSARFQKTVSGALLTLTLIVRDTVAPGEYRITIHGASGTLTRTTTMALIVAP